MVSDENIGYCVRKSLSLYAALSQINTGVRNVTKRRTGEKNLDVADGFVKNENVVCAKALKCASVTEMKI
jgi:hypothetical protein